MLRPSWSYLGICLATSKLKLFPLLKFYSDLNSIRIVFSIHNFRGRKTIRAIYMVSSKLTKTPQSIRVGSLLKRSTLRGPCQVGMTVPQTAIWDDPGRFLRSASHRTIHAENLARLAALSTFTVATMRAQSTEAHSSSKNGLCFEYGTARHTSNRVGEPAEGWTRKDGGDGWYRAGAGR